MSLSNFKKKTPYWLVGALALTTTTTFAEQAVSAKNANTQIEKTKTAVELEDEEETITILGSRLRGIETGSPVITMDREFIESGGFSSIEDLFQHLPQGMSSRNSTTTALGLNEALESPTAKPLSALGSSGINLRGMGGQSTLVLVNGRRSATSSNSLGGYTDISSIPLSMIERIDVLTDGASAIYGADAVAGVVDIILRKDYTGGTLGLRHENSATGGDSTRVNGGYTFNWNGGSLTGSFDVSKRKPVDTNLLMNEGPMGVGDFTALGGVNTRTVGAGDSGTVYQGSPNWWEPKQFIGLVPEGHDGTNFQPTDLMAGDANSRSIYERHSLGPEIDRQTFRINGEQELADDHYFSFEVAVTNQEDAANWQARLQDFSVISNGLTTVSAINPNNNFGQNVFVGYGFANEFKGIELSSNSKQDNVFAYVSFDGELSFIEGWEYKLDYSYSSDKNSGSSLRNPYDFTPEGFEKNTNFNNNINPFGDGSNADIVNANRELLVGLLARQGFESESDASVFEMTANGPVFELPGGEAMLAIGMAMRNEDLSREYPGIDNLTPISYERDTTSYFAELGLPLTESLSLTVALRREEVEQNGISSFMDAGYSYDWATFTPVQIELPGIDHKELTGYDRTETAYEVVGPEAQAHEFSQTSPSVKISWMPVDSFKLRATWGESFLAPRAAQMYGSSNVGDNAFLWQLTGHDIPEGSVSNGVPVVYTLSGVNQDLEAQTADTMTAGFDWFPESVPSLSFSVTYSVIDFDNYIGAAPDPFDGEPFTLLTENLDKAGDVITYADNGVLIYDQRERNFSQRTSKTIDIYLKYSHQTQDMGTINFDLNAVNTLDLSSTFIPGLDPVELQGTDVGPSEWVGNFSTMWTIGNFNSSAVLRYVSSFTTLTPLTEWRDVQNNIHQVENPDDDTDAMLTVDAQVTWNMPNTGFKIQLGAANLFDEKPDFVNNRAGFSGSRYNTRGRVVYLDMSYTFGN